MTNDKPFVNISGRINISSGFLEIPDTMQARIDGSASGGLIVVGKQGTLNICGGHASQYVRHTLIEPGGYMNVSGCMASAYDTYINSGGSMAVIDGGCAFEVEVDGDLRFTSAAGDVGHIHVNSGGRMCAEATWIQRAEAREKSWVAITSGAHVEIIEICSGATCIVRSASVARAYVRSGGTLSVIDGTSTETFIQSGGIMKKSGRCKIHYQSISEVGGAVFKDYCNAEED